MDKIRQGMSDKIVLVLSAISALVSGVVIAFSFKQVPPSIFLFIHLYFHLFSV
jgi:uncharacterized membrane protein